MKTPSHFVIKGEHWDVDIKEKVIVEDEVCEGSADPDTRKIEIKESLEGYKHDHTLLHEFLHAALHELHIHNLETQEEEVIVDGLAKCLLDNFRIDIK